MTTPIKICLREKCFMWREKDDLCAPGLHSSLSEALKVAIRVDEGSCRLPDSFGVACIRDWIGVGVDLKIILNQMMQNYISE
ncbi:hypothetical protein [Pelosinus sp. IPA-1]|uniref:hypothetical protein n=1 Tax=Pelosinus sp. IPA-1 TaxID=3029569 RepID=UPI00243621E0|nr:hypothetical protein [Pelosinus sp. IPA-1]GMA99472.1 hypothetical protein PIPA1_22720 [Pelosinus sp. IPA-1]